MDNLRRVFLTKDEVRSLGTELTNQTTDDIQALWLPVRGLRDVLGTSSSILFKYRTKDHSDFYATARGSSGSSYVGHDYARYPVKLNSNSLQFTWQYTKNTNSGNCSRNVYFTDLAGSMYDGNSSTNPNLNIVDMMGEDIDWYVRIDITKISLNLVYYTSFYNSTTAKDFLIQYLSGDVPADTIFYEPYEG